MRGDPEAGAPHECIANFRGTVRRFFGVDEPNYATMKDRKLLHALGELRPQQLYFRAHICWTRVMERQRSNGAARFQYDLITTGWMRISGGSFPYTAPPSALRVERN